MIILKEVTLENYKQFIGLLGNVMVVESNQEGRKEYNELRVGIIVRKDMDECWRYYVQFSNGTRTQGYVSFLSLISDQSEFFYFVNIEIKNKK
jgi:hypothetical protein